jgi:predicted metal-binding membrane protein
VTVATTPARQTPWVALVATGSAWLVIVTAHLIGRGDVFGHGPGADVAAVARPLVAVGTWQVMVAAMMTPSTVPMWRAFAVASDHRPGAGRARAGLLAGYACVWGAFGAAAFALDLVLHRLVDAIAWLGARPWAVTGVLLAVAGAGQLLPLTQACLRACRHPMAYLLQHHRPGTAAAFRLGRAYGLSCVGCCWALMVVGFAAGAAHLGLMAALTVVMTYEKVGRHGATASIGAGIVLLVWSGATIATAGALTPSLDVGP